MRHLGHLLAASCLLAACGGHTGAPASGAAPAASRGDPSSLRYAAGASHYRIEQNQHLSQEMMGQTRDMDGATTILVSATLTGAPGGDLAAVFTVDSVVATSTIPGAAAVLAGIRGKTYRAVYSPLGRSLSYTPPDSGDAAAGEGNVFREFLPTLPAGSLEAGSAWTDTSTMEQRGSTGLAIRSQSVRQHRVVGWELHDGVRALRITSTSAYTLTGGGTQQGQQMSVTGSGLASVDQFVSAAGVYLGGSAADSSAMTVTVVTMGMDVPVRQTRRVTIARLP